MEKPSPAEVDVLMKIASEAIKVNQDIIDTYGERFLGNAKFNGGEARMNGFNPFDGLNVAINTGGAYAGYQTSSPNSYPGVISGSNSYTPFTLNRIWVAFAWMTHSVLQDIIELPVEDAFAQGFTITSPDLSVEQCCELAEDFTKAHQIWSIPSGASDLEKATVYQSAQDFAKSDLETLKAVLRWQSLFGGSGLIIACNQKMTDPLKLKGLKGAELQFIDATRWELVLNTPLTYDPAIECPYNYYGKPIHRSRVVKLQGIEPPPEIRVKLQGWGLSTLEKCIRPANAALRMQNLVFNILEEMKVDVMLIQGYNAALLNPRGQAAIAARAEYAMANKSFTNSLVMDANDKFQQKTVPLTGLSDLWDQTRKEMVSASGIPASKLYGDAGAGLRSGDGDVQNYAQKIQAKQRQAVPPMMAMLNLRCIQKYGFVAKLKINFPQVEVISGVELEEVKTQRLSRIETRYNLGFLTGQEAEQEAIKDGITEVQSLVAQGKRQPKPPASAVPKPAGGLPAKQSSKTRDKKKSEK